MSVTKVDHKQILRDDPPHTCDNETTEKIVDTEAAVDDERYDIASCNITIEPDKYDSLLD